MTEDVRECVGHLKAELLEAKELFLNGKMSEVAALTRIAVIRLRARSVRTRQTQAMLLLLAATANHNDYQSATDSGPCGCNPTAVV